MITCDSCLAAEEDPLTGRYHLGCKECATRQLAHGLERYEAVVMRQLTPAYEAALKLVFGAEWEAGLLRVKELAQRIDAARKG